MTKIVQTYYISSGAKNAMYTLRCRRDCVGQAPSMYQFMPDFYLCNLSANEEKAIEKAKLYVQSMRERIGENENFTILFDDCPDQEIYHRRGKLSAQQSRYLDLIEQGILPFGKHSGTKIEEAPASYLLFFADKAKDPTADVIMQALSAACAGVALHKGYIAVREAQREERAAQDSLSNHIGTIGERRMFQGELYLSFFKGPQNDYDGFGYWINKVRCGNDIVTYIGSKALGTQGTTVSFKATIKNHDTYKGIKTTVVNRPA